MPSPANITLHTKIYSLKYILRLTIFLLLILLGIWGMFILANWSKVKMCFNIVKGVVTVRSEVFSQLKKIIYKCIKCGFLKGPFYINSLNSIKLGNCTSCQSTGPFPIDKQKTIYRNYQKITLQEAPSEVLPGRIPRRKEVILYGDNIDLARPGDYI